VSPQRAWRIPRLLVQLGAINARDASPCRNPGSVQVSQNIMRYMLQFRPTLDILNFVLHYQRKSATLNTKLLRVNEYYHYSTG